MGPKGLLLSFLGVGAITGTVIGSYCVLSPDKSNTTSEKQNSEQAGQETKVSTPASNPAPTETALPPGSPSKPNNVETVKGPDSPTVNPGRPEPSASSTRNPDAGAQGSGGPSGQAAEAK